MSKETYLEITYSKEAAHRLGKADFDMRGLLETELKRKDPSVKINLDAIPNASGATDKEVVLIILAAGVTASLVLSAISRILVAQGNKERASTPETTQEPALDAKGEVIRDNVGNPAYKVTQKQSAEAAEQERGRVKVGADWLKFEISTGDAAKEA